MGVSLPMESVKSPEENFSAKRHAEGGFGGATHRGLQGLQALRAELIHGVPKAAG
jgi:hypothetical protein